MSGDTLWAVIVLGVFEIGFISVLLAHGRRRTTEKPLIGDAYRLAGRARRF